MLSLSSGVYAQSTKVSMVDVAFKLVDKQGKPIQNAEVIVGEGASFAETDKLGDVSLTLNPSSVITIKQPGYEISTINVEDIVGGVVELNSTPTLASYADVVTLPYTQTTKRASTGDYIVISGEDLCRYPTLDLRNALAALAPGLIVTENNGATGSFTNYTEDRVSLSTRTGAPMYYIDDTPIDINDLSVDASEVESVTIIKDVVGKAKFGPRAANGIVYIKTKRGNANDRVLSVSVEKGIQQVDIMPSVASGADYARINNMARTNDGMDALYSSADIAAYALNNSNDLVNPSTDFLGMMFTDIKNYDKYSVASSGGNDFAQYYANIGYLGEGDNFALGEKSNYKDITFRSTINMKLNDIVSVDVGLYGGLKLRNSPNYSQGDDEVTLEFDNALDLARTVSPIAFPVYLPIASETGNPVYGVGTSFTTNPVAQLEGGGYHQERGRTGSVNAALNFKLDALVEGLSSKTYVNLVSYNQTRIGKSNTYDSRTSSVSGADTTYVIKTNYSVSTSESKITDYYYQYLAGFQQFNYARTFGDHSVNADAVLYMSKYSREGIENPYLEQNLSFTGSYSYRDRYYFDFAVSHSGSMALSGDNKFRTFPSFGLGWIASDEEFMQGAKFLDFLKVRGQYGILGYTTDNPTVRQYENQWVITSTANTFGPYASTDATWLGSYGTTTTAGTYYGKWKNEDIDWEIRKELNVGFDALMFDKKLSFTANYYNTVRDGMWSRVEYIYPLMSGLIAYPMLNYESTRYYGVETYASYTDKIGDLTYRIGASAAFNRSRLLAYDEPNYGESESYLLREGQSATVIYGYVHQGTFATDEEAQAVIQSNDTTLYAGDLKYEDKNGDGVLDSKDMVAIGDSAPKVYYTVNLALAYKNFELNVVGDGKAGYQMLTNSHTYFAGGWGDDNYSQGVIDRIDSGNYPRVTYTKVNNNFLASEYWLVDRSYFKIQNVELAYNLKCAGLDKLGIRKVRFFARAANLYTATSLEGVDPESTYSGITSYPLSTTYTGGFNITF